MDNLMKPPPWYLQWDGLLFGQCHLRGLHWLTQYRAEKKHYIRPPRTYYIRPPRIKPLDFPSWTLKGGYPLVTSCVYSNLICPSTPHFIRKCILPSYSMVRSVLHFWVKWGVLRQISNVQRWHIEDSPPIRDVFLAIIPLFFSGSLLFLTNVKPGN